MRHKNCVIEDGRLGDKFCAAMSRHYLCQQAGLCRSHPQLGPICPFARAVILYEKDGICVLGDQRHLRKFCGDTNKTLGCRGAFGTSKDRFGQCKSCPLATAEQTLYLINLKGLPTGEAVKQTLRGPVSAEEAHEILQAYARLPRPYPEEGGE